MPNQKGKAVCLALTCRLLRTLNVPMGVNVGIRVRRGPSAQTGGFGVSKSRAQNK